MIRLEVNGDQYQGFISATVERHMDALSGRFSFTATSQNGRPLPFVGGEACRVIVDTVPVLTGYIEKVDVTYQDTTHDIFIQGRDKTTDLIDSTLVPINDLRGAGITLEGIIREVVEQLGLDIDVIDQAGTILQPFNAAEDVVGPDPGENAFEFLEKYSRKRQALLTTNGNGDITIVKPTGIRINAFIQHIVDATNNNVLGATASFDMTNRFNKYTFVSSKGFVALNSAGSSDLAEAVDQSGGTTDPAIRVGRQLVIVPETSSSNDQNELRAQWEANIRQTRGKTYSVTVPGFRNQTGDIWRQNTIISVVDEFVGINSQMLINSVRYNLDIDTGSTTTLTLLPSNAYTLELEEPRTETVGSGLFS